MPLPASVKQHLRKGIQVCIGSFWLNIALPRKPKHLGTTEHGTQALVVQIAAMLTGQRGCAQFGRQAMLASKEKPWFNS